MTVTASKRFGHEHWTLPRDLGRAISGSIDPDRNHKFFRIDDPQKLIENRPDAGGLLASGNDNGDFRQARSVHFQEVRIAQAPAIPTHCPNFSACDSKRADL